MVAEHFGRHFSTQSFSAHFAEECPTPDIKLELQGPGGLSYSNQAPAAKSKSSIRCGGVLDWAFRCTLSLPGRSHIVEVGNRSVRLFPDIRPSPYLKTYLAVRHKNTHELVIKEANVVTVAADVEHPESSNPLLKNVRQF